jgi:hypothetical protein
MLLKIIAEIIIGHNRVIYHSDLPGNIPTEERLKSDQATQGAIHATVSTALPLLFAFTRLALVAFLSAPINPTPAPLVRRSHHTVFRGLTHPTTVQSRRHLCTTGRQRHRPHKQGQNRNQQYEGEYLSHYSANINKKLAIL